MKFDFNFLAAVAIALACVGQADADVFIAGADGSVSVTGNTTTIEGSEFIPQGASDNWAEGSGVVGTDWVGTTGGTATNNPSDWYLIVNGSNITDAGLTVSENRYVEVFYTLGSAFTQAGTASDNRFFLSDSGQGNNGENPQDTTLVPASAGDHSFVLDLLSSDGVDLDGDFDGTQIWDQFRWDMWNDADNLAANTGIEFTLDRVVFGNAIVAIPEPGSVAILAFGSVVLLAQRRRKRA